MKQLSILIVSIFTFLFSYSQKQNVYINIGANNNFSPIWSFSPEIGISYKMAKGGELGYLLMNDVMGNKTYNIPHYKAKLGKRTTFIGGLSFVNDYSGDKRVLKESPALGMNYNFDQGKKDNLKLYGGFLYTYQRLYLRVGIYLFKK